jgi:hypothetical protein
MRCEYELPELNAEIEYTLAASGDHVATEAATLFRLLVALHRIVAMDSFNFNAAGTDAIYNYNLVAADSRRFDQTLQFGGDDPRNPGQTFAVSDTWKLSEFRVHRPVRDHIVLMYNEIGLQRVSVIFK